MYNASLISFSTVLTPLQLTCHLCGTLQHLDCYGLNGTVANRNPAEHFCYTCLLLPQEEDVCCRMPKLVRKRLAILHFTNESGDECKVDDHLLTALRLDPQDPHSWTTTSNVLAELQDEGYLSNTSSSWWRMVDNKRTEAEYTYVDHLIGIGDHVSWHLPCESGLLTHDNSTNRRKTD